MDQPQCKDKLFLRKKEFNFYLTSYVMLVVSLSVILNGLKILNMSDQEEWIENGNKKQNLIFLMSFKKLQNFQPKNSIKPIYYKAHVK
jgi:hypothetical protein